MQSNEPRVMIILLLASQNKNSKNPVTEAGIKDLLMHPVLLVFNFCPSTCLYSCVEIYKIDRVEPILVFSVPISRIIKKIPF